MTEDARATDNQPRKMDKSDLGCFGCTISVPILGLLLLIALAINDHAKEARYRTEYCNPGDAAYQRGDYATALIDYQKFEKLYPGDSQTLHSEAWGLIRLGRLGEARQDLVDAINNEPRDGRYGGGPPSHPAEDYQWRAELKELEKPNVSVHELVTFVAPPYHPPWGGIRF